MKCLFCPKNFDYFQELLHHMKLDHSHIPSKILENATLARETKKQLGEYIAEGAKGIAFDCPECFEIFTDYEKLNIHRKKLHHMQFTDEAKKKLDNLPIFDENNPPQCERCAHLFLGLVICVIDGETVSVCLTCYEKHYGVNALRQITIGTPENILKKMREPLVIK